jgi:phage protein D/phage baseplate assembly protein gpV
MPASSIDTPLYRILINGAEIDAAEANCVHEIKVTDWLRLPDACSLQVGYPAEDGPTPFEALDKSKFKIGSELKVKLGAADETVSQTIFDGEIVTVEPEFHAGSVAMVVRAYDKTHRMMRTRKQRVFVKQKISDIVTKICSEYGIRPETITTGAVLEAVFQHNETDFDFILRLAKRVGFEFAYDAPTGKFRPPQRGTPTVTLRYPEDLRTFRPRITAVQQVQTVNVRGFDFKAKKQVMATQSNPQQVTSAGIKRTDVVNTFGAATLEIGGQSFTDRAEADAMAQAALDQLANAYLAADGSCAGNPNIKAGILINIAGVGRNYSGTYRVAKATHVLRGGAGYVTSFSNSAGEHTLLGQVNGSVGGPRQANSITVGIVTNNKDPEALGRVRVKLPAMSDVESDWVPVLLPAAGVERGISMLPMPGDQVVVAFENGDPSYPYVIGSMFNGRDKPGKEMATDDGSFALKSNKKALIAAREDITLRSDGGKWIINVDGGEITENVKSGKGGSGGYTGEFAGAYKVKATGAVTIEANQGVTIKALSVKVEAQTSISIESQATLSLKGAQVSIEGQAAVNITGALINIG